MKSPSFQIELLGGPADGLRVAADTVPGRMIRMHSGPATGWRARFRQHRSRGTHLAEYEMLWSRYGIDSSGMPIVHVSYDFVGSKAVRNISQAKRFVGKLTGGIGVSWWKGWTRALRRSVATTERATTEIVSSEIVSSERPAGDVRRL